MPVNRHRLLLMLDEFPILGRLEVLAEALSLIPVTASAPAWWPRT